MKHNKKISIVIPVYFNSESLNELFVELNLLTLKFNEIEMGCELIFVDDGSGDDSLYKLLTYKESVNNAKVVKLTRNFGSMHAIKIGFGFVSGNCFAVLAADLQDPPNLIYDMATKWLNGAKFVICERISRSDPPLTKMFSAIYYKILRATVMHNYPEGGFDMCLMDRDMLNPMINSSKNSYMALLAYWLGYKPEVIRYHRRERPYGQSKWTFSKKVKAFIDIILGFSVTPIRAISALGFLVSVASVSYGLLVVFVAIFHGNPVAGFPTVVALITFLLGLIIIMLGIIGEYLWRIFDETNKRPEAVIEKVY